MENWKYHTPTENVSRIQVYQYMNLNAFEQSNNYRIENNQNILPIRKPSRLGQYSPVPQKQHKTIILPEFGLKNNILQPITQNIELQNNDGGDQLQIMKNTIPSKPITPNNTQRNFNFPKQQKPNQFKLKPDFPKQKQLNKPQNQQKLQQKQKQSNIFHYNEKISNYLLTIPELYFSESTKIYIPQNLTPSYFRNQIVDNILKITDDYKLNQNVFFTAISIFNRYVWSIEQQLTVQKYDCIAQCCIFLAYKCEGNDRHNHGLNFKNLIMQNISLDDLLQLEGDIVKQLDYKIISSPLLTLLNCYRKEQDSMIYKCSLFLLYLSQYSFLFVSYRLDKIIQSCIQVAKLIQQKINSLEDQKIKYTKSTQILFKLYVFYRNCRNDQKQFENLRKHIQNLEEKVDNKKLTIRN